MTTRAEAVVQPHLPVAGLAQSGLGGIARGEVLLATDHRLRAMLVEVAGVMAIVGRLLGDS